MFFRGYKVASPGAGAVIVCFFLPWFFVSCYGQPIAEFSGFDLAIGPTIRGPLGTEKMEGAPNLWLLPCIGIAILVLAYFASRRQKLMWLDKFGIIILGLFPLLYALSNLNDSAAQLAQMEAEGIQVLGRIGLWGTLFGTVLITIGGVINWINRGVANLPKPVAQQLDGKEI